MAGRHPSWRTARGPAGSSGGTLPTGDAEAFQRRRTGRVALIGAAVVEAGEHALGFLPCADAVRAARRRHGGAGAEVVDQGTRRARGLVVEELPVDHDD